MNDNNIILRLLSWGAVVSGLLAAFRVVSVLVFYEYYDKIQVQSYLIQQNGRG